MNQNFLATDLENNCSRMQHEIARTNVLRQNLEVSIREIRGEIAKTRLLCRPTLKEIEMRQQIVAAVPA